jgi:predicted nucleotidyltransferase
MLKTFVQSTHRIPLFSHSYRSFYAAVLNRFVSTTRGLPAVKSVMLKGSYARREHVPGISDIDLAIVIHDATTYSELCELAQAIVRFKRGLVLTHCPIVGEIEVFSHADTMSPMFKSYSERFSWRVVSGDPVPFSNSPPDTPEQIWSNFGKFVFFHTVSPNFVPLHSQRHRAAGLARTLGICEVPSDNLAAYSVLIQRFDDLLARFVSSESSYPLRFETDHIGPFTGCGNNFRKEYILVENFEPPANAVEAERKPGLCFPPTYVGPNAMRFVTGPFEDRRNQMWANINLETVRYQWRGSFVNNVSANEGFLARSTFVDLVRLLCTLKMNPLVPTDEFSVPDLPPKDAVLQREDFQSIYEIFESIQYPST